jgi:hypothetical protein
MTTGEVKYLAQCKDDTSIAAGIHPASETIICQTFGGAECPTFELAKISSWREIIPPLNFSLELRFRFYSLKEGI